MAVCPKCGASYPEGSRFCTECGTMLEAAPAVITADTPIPEPALTLPEIPEMDVPVPEVPSVEPEAPAAGAEPALGFFHEPDPAEFPKPPEPAPAPVYEAPKPAPQPVYPQSAPQPQPVYQQPAPDADRPGKKSRFAPMTSWGMAVQLVLMNLPVVGFILMVVWACGGCRKIARRNLARANLILLIFAIIVIVAAALLARFAFSDVITSIFEQLLPGYTLQWS